MNSEACTCTYIRTSQITYIYLNCLNFCIIIQCDGAIKIVCASTSGMVILKAACCCQLSTVPWLLRWMNWIQVYICTYALYIFCMIECVACVLCKFKLTFSCLVILVNIPIMLLLLHRYRQVTKWRYTCKQKFCHQNGGRIK